MQTEIFEVNVFGLGKIGTILASIISSKGLQVNGFDPHPEYFLNLSNGLQESSEPGFGDLLPYTTNVNVNPREPKVISRAGMSLIIVPTPSTANGAYELKFVMAAVEEILRNLELQDRHVVVIKSTVLPGDIAKIEQMAWSRGFENLHFVYNPEFIALGDVISNMSKPDLVLIGARKSEIAKKVLDLNALIIQNQPTFAILDVEEAELAKVSLNSYVTMKISFANLIGQAAKRLGSANPANVLLAIGADSRIGTKYLRPGMGFGGPCFPRDNRALAKSLSDLGLSGELLGQVDKVNKAVPDSWMEQIRAALRYKVQQNMRVLLVGAAYKLGSPETVESQSIEILQKISKEFPNAIIDVYDPLVEALPDSLSDTNCNLTAHESLSRYHLIFLALPYFASAELEPYLHPDGEVISPWGN
jgi:UDPglucose 6-dehydrogenase